MWPVLVFDALFLNMVLCVFSSADDCIKKEEHDSSLPNTLTESSTGPTRSGEHTFFTMLKWILGLNSIRTWEKSDFYFLEIYIFCRCQSHVSQNGHSKIFFHNLRYMYDLTVAPIFFCKKLNSSCSI